MRTRFNDCGLNSTRPPKQNTNLRPSHWTLIGILVGLFIGFCFGNVVKWPTPNWIRNLHNDGAADAAYDRRQRSELLVAKYQEEVVRLNQRRDEDQIARNEKQLLLAEMMRRGVDSNSLACRRIKRELEELTASIAKTDDRLLRVREQASTLTTARNAEERRNDGLDRSVEIDARRFLLEHDAGLEHE